MFLHLNQVQQAINKAGGPTKVSNLLHVSNSTVHNWVKAGRITNIDHARVLAKVTGFALEELRGVR